MLGALIIVFREVISGIDRGIVGWCEQPRCGPGMDSLAAGPAGSALVAVFTGAIASAFDGYGQKFSTPAFSAPQ